MKVWKDFLHHLIPTGGNAYRPHLLTTPWLIFFLTIVLTSEGIFVGSLVVQQSGMQLTGAVLQGEVIALTNGERAQNNVGLLHENNLLDAAAQAKADDMAKHGYFSHVGPDGKEPWAWISQAGYAYQSAGENLAVRFSDSADVVNAWMASPSHRANMVKPVYTEIGVGTAQGQFEGTPTTYVVQYFATPFSVASAQSAQQSEVPAAVTPVAQARVAAQVAGAETNTEVAVATPTTSPIFSTPQANVQKDRLSDSGLKQVLRVAAETPTSVFYILAGISSLLVLLLALAFFIHIEIQPTEMLLGGALVVVIAFFFIVLNSHIPLPTATVQSASVFEANPGGIIGSDGATIEFSTL
jgi:uncharacterized protein YkwD